MAPRSGAPPAEQALSVCSQSQSHTALATRLREHSRERCAAPVGALRFVPPQPGPAWKAKDIRAETSSASFTCELSHDDIALCIANAILLPG